MKNNTDPVVEIWDATCTDTFSTSSRRQSAKKYCSLINQNYHFITFSVEIMGLCFGAKVPLWPEWNDCFKNKPNRVRTETIQTDNTERECSGNHGYLPSMWKDEWNILPSVILVFSNNLINVQQTENNVQMLTIKSFAFASKFRTIFSRSTGAVHNMHKTFYNYNRHECNS